MVLGPWGSLWKFVLLATGIGVASGLTYMVYETVRSLFEQRLYIELITIGGIAGGLGAGLGLIMGSPRTSSFGSVWIVSPAGSQPGYSC